jgi:phosphotriesterase-related protein
VSTSAPQVPQRTVQTVRGPVPAEQLGATLMHEHFVVRDPAVEGYVPEPEWDRERVLREARVSLQGLVDKGIGTIVDMTVPGLARRPLDFIAEATVGLALNVVVATGFYTAKDLPTYFRNHGPDLKVDGPDPLVELFRRDVTEGILDGHGVRAGVIKVVTDRHGITPDVERIMDAAATVARETGVLISTHTSVANQAGLLQQEFFTARGIPAERLLIGHSGDSTDLDYLRRMMDAGSTLGFDRFGLTWENSDEARVKTIAALCQEGYADRIVLSHDAAFYSVNTEPSFRRTTTPDWHHHHISDWVLPGLRDAGVSEAEIDQMTVRTPARLLPLELR